MINKFSYLVLFTLLLLPCRVLAENANVTNVGVILPLSGDAASVGQAIRNAMELSYNRLTKDSQSKLKLFFEDDALKAVNTISAFNKLAAVNNISVVVTASSGTSKALAPIAEAQRIPLIAIASDPEVVKGRRYVVNFFTTPEEEVKTMLPEIKRRNYRRIARISSAFDWSEAMRKTFDAMNQGTTEVVLSDEYPMDVKDFRPFLTKLRQTPEIDAVLVTLMPGQCGVFAKQARQSGITVPLFGFEMFEDSAEVKVSEGALVGQWYVNARDPNGEFIENYKRAYPNGSFFGAANGFDIVAMLAQATESSTDKEQINLFLHQVKNFSGALGTYSATGDGRFSLPAAVKVVTEDGFKQQG